MSKGMLWVHRHPSGWIESKLGLLKQRGFEVTSLVGMHPAQASSVWEKRFGVMVLSNDFPPDEMQHLLAHVVSWGETRSSRLVLMVHQSLTQEQGLLAALQNVRDFIPIDLPEATWWKRFEFAIASHPKVFFDPFFPTGAVTLQWMIQAHLPARITWMSAEQIRIESHLMPRIHTRWMLKGALAKALGEASLALQVDSLHYDHLDHRFSGAFMASPILKGAQKTKWQHIYDTLAPSVPKIRIMLAVADLPLKARVFKSLPAHKFYVHSVLRPQNLTKDPLYFSPHVALIDEGVIYGKSQEAFHAFMEQTGKTIPLVIASGWEGFLKLQETYPHHKLLFWDPLSGDLPPLDTIAAGHSMGQALASGKWIEPLHPLSPGQWIIPGRMILLHPQYLALALPTYVKPFALLQVYCPALPKHLPQALWFKSTDAYESSSHTSTGEYAYRLDGFWTSHMYQAPIARLLSEILPQELAPWYAPLHASPLHTALLDPTLSLDPTSPPPRADPEALPKRLPPKTLKEELISALFSQTMAYVWLGLWALALMIGGLAALAPKLAPYYKHSGGVFVEQLKKFSKPEPRPPDPPLP